MKWILRGSTLAELLVTMLVAGIVLLTVMDGFTLFMRMQTRRAGALQAIGRQTEGFFRLAALAAGADSIRAVDERLWELYRRGACETELALADSALICRKGAFRDTLLTGVGTLRVLSQAALPDTLEVLFTTGAVLRLAAARPAAEQYRTAIERIERGYGCEE